jgi:hypothetical protein
MTLGMIEFTVIAGGLATSIYLFLSLKRELPEDARRRKERRLESIAERLRQAEESMQIRQS